MKSCLLFFLFFCSIVSRSKAAQVLIVADEIPAMEIVAKALKIHENIASKIVLQTKIPNDLSAYMAVLVYIHKDLNPAAEKAFIDYTKAGGKLILLHHSISSHKRKNADWFAFMGVELLKKDLNEGGYGYVGDINMEIVNLAPSILSQRIKLNIPKNKLSTGV